MSDHILREDIHEACAELFNEILSSNFKVTLDGNVVYEHKKDDTKEEPSVEEEWKNETK